MKALYKVSVSAGFGYECIADCDLDLQKGDQVIVRCERFLDFATIERRCPGEPLEDEAAFEKQRAQKNKGRHIEGQKIPVVIRKANGLDKAKAAENDEKAENAHAKALERIKFHGLDMKLIHTHYAFDRKILVFQFSAEGRIDFRELLRDLSGLFHVRVELRQVGVRDETAILGGIGTCGRPFCCATFLPSFSSINVKMAKQQGLSLNPQNISGWCGRLKCCLQYEAEFYRNNTAQPKNQASETQTEVKENTQTNPNQGKKQKRGKKKGSEVSGVKQQDTFDDDEPVLPEDTENAGSFACETEADEDEK